MASSSSSARLSARPSGRADLFQQYGPANEEKGEGLRKPNSPTGASPEDDSPLQLEHILGYAGLFRNNCVMIPGAGDGRLFAKALGNLLVLENLQDPHDQKLLRGHDSPISALAVSSSGSFIASGQVGTEKYRGRASPIFLWDPLSGKRLNLLKGLTTRVNAMAFSLDEKFLCGCGEDCLVYIWDVQTGETVACQRLLSPPTVVKWVNQLRSQHYTSYELVLDIGNAITQVKLQYDPAKVQWGLKFTPYATPAGGSLIRTYTCLDASADRAFVYVGSSAGELLVYRRDPPVFRACIPVCSNGVQAMAVLPQSQDVVCGGGDGSVKKLSGSDMAWQLVLETTLGASEGRVRALSCTSSGAELLVACSSGSILRCMSEDFSYAVVGNGNTSAVTSMAFSSAPGASIFATGSQGGELRVWDIVDYACLATFSYPKAAVMCVCLLQDGDSQILVSGWDDGFIRAHDTQTLNRQLWYIPTAHRGGTRSLAAHTDPTLQYFVSGGADGTIRVWRLQNRELVTQYTEHTKGVARVLVDVAKPNIVHSVGIDCTVLSYDLRAAKRVICHLVTTGGSMTDMTQRRDGENELVTCDTQARLLHWDIDVRDPTVAVQDPSLSALRCVQISPSGRFLAFAGDDQVVKVLDMERGQIVALGHAHCSAILCLNWTPDERQLVSGGEDSSICVWNFYLV